MTKTFTIGNPLPTEHTPNTYEVEIKLMHGDADAESLLTVKPFQLNETEALNSLLTVLDTMSNLYPNGRGGNYDEFGFHNVEGFYSWFGDITISSKDQYKNYSHSTVPYETYLHHKNFVTPERANYWEWDYTNPEIEADIESYTVYYYDDNLIKHEVNITNT